MNEPSNPGQETKDMVLSYLDEMFSQSFSKEFIEKKLNETNWDVNICLDNLVELRDSTEENLVFQTYNSALFSEDDFPPPCAKQEPSSEINPEVKTPRWSKLISNRDEFKINVAKSSPKSSILDVPQNIIDKLNTQTKLMLIMRGLPGSGKSYLAENLQRHYNGIILSTDDYFYDKAGHYKYNPSQLPEAHTWNQSRCKTALQSCITPVIIDNTNLQFWEMIPYIDQAYVMGYDINLLEPNTIWRLSTSVLAKKNLHGVPAFKLKQMRDRYENLSDFHVTSYLFNKFGLTVDESTQSSPKSAFNMIENPDEAPEHNGEIATEKDIKDIGIDVNNLNQELKSMSINSIEKIEEVSHFDNDDSSKDVEISALPRRKHLKINKKLPIVTEMRIQPTKNEESPDWNQSWDVVPQANDLNDNIMLPKRNKRRAEKFADPKKCGPPSDEGKGNSDNLVTLSSLEHSSSKLCCGYNSIDRCDKSVQTSDFSMVHQVLKSKSNILKVISSRGCWIAPISKDIPYPSMVFHKSCQTDVPEVTQDENDLAKLKAMFIDTCPDFISDFLQKCHGNLPWAAELLLEAGCSMNPDYDLCLELITNGIGIEQRQELNLCHEDKEPNEDIILELGKSASSDLNHQANSGSEILYLPLHPNFLKQLTREFGPAHFNLTEDCICEDNLLLPIPKSLGKSIHSLLVSSLAEKFAREQAYLDGVINDAGDSTTDNELHEDDTYGNQLNNEIVYQNDTQFRNCNQNDQSTAGFNSMASFLKLKQLKQDYPFLPDDFLKDCFKTCNYKYEDTKYLLDENYGTKDHQNVLSPEALEHYKDKLHSLEHEDEKFDHSHIKTDGNLDTIDNPRSEALSHYKKRKEYLYKARAASNNGGIASYYAMKAKEHGDKMKMANYAAAEKIFSASNLNLPNNSIDLHLLHVNEAVMILDAWLDHKKQLIASKKEKKLKLTVITGRGKHSVQKQVRILPAVIKYLNKQNIRHCLSNPGSLQVVLT